MLTKEGRCDGGIAFQDSLKHVLWRSILGFLPRTVLESNPPTPASISMQFNHQKPLAHDFAHSRGCAVANLKTLSDIDVAIEHFGLIH